MTENEEEKLSPPGKFLFPFEPYSIQVDFMKALYEAIEEKKIGIFESPTGTGKSLSLICGAVTWLRDHEERYNRRIENILSSRDKKKIRSVENATNENNEPSWVEEFAQKTLISGEVKAARESKETRMKKEREIKKMKVSGKLHAGNKKFSYLKRKRDLDVDETLLLLKQAKKEIENYETNRTSEDLSSEDPEDIALALDEYLSDDEKDADDNENKEEEQEDCFTKIFFCSRTHSQLSQFIRELQKSPYGDMEDFDLTVGPLASRNSLCINESIRKLSSLQQINDKCLEMQKNSKETKSKKKDKDPEKTKTCRRPRVAKPTCCYYGNGEGMEQVVSKIVAKISDIEEIVEVGKELQACPYYATRHAIPYSRLVVLPYQTLLHQSTRIASGINIKDSVIIIDEAHNLVEAINSMYSCQINLKQVAKSLNQLQQYAKKFNKRLKAKNLFYVKQLVFVLRKFLSVMQPGKSSDLAPKVKEQDTRQKTETTLLTVNEFLFQSSLDNINFFKLLKYCQSSKISQKLNGFAEKYEVALHDRTSKPPSALSTFLSEIKNSGSTSKVLQSTSSGEITMRSPLMHIESFFFAMTSLSKDGRVSIATSTAGEGSFIKFLLLNPSAHFQQILDDCRALIVAGGTMQPSSCMIDQLLPQAEQTRYLPRIVEFSCGHVIDGSTQLLPIALSTGPSNENFEFTFEKRKRHKTIDELGRLLLNVSNIIPGGIVCFFPSYEYENYVHSRWNETGMLSKIECKKKIFCERKQDGHVDKVLLEYRRSIERSRKLPGKISGALLLSVVGGKMSEGINFSDDLGRCVIMVGLPYPNLHSPELKEKMAYLDRNMRRNSDGRSAGQVHYENLCMKAVNQCIGRAIRHRNDYACLLLVDQRYGRPSVANKLPQWIGKHLHKIDQFGRAFGAIKKFFNEKKSK